MQNSGLTGLRFDLRDRFFSHSKLFGTADLSQLPKEGLGRKPISIKNQGFTSFCTAFSTACGREYQEGIELSPEYQVALISQVVGSPILNGADGRDALKALTAFGSLPQADAPYRLGDKSPEFIANLSNWPTDRLVKAGDHKAQAFFTVDGPYDAFDNIRTALMAGKDENQVVYVFGKWFTSWNSNGVRKLIKESVGGNSLHAYVIFDFGQLDDEDCVKVQQTYGTAAGDQGIQYLSREAVNAAFAYNSIFAWLFGPRLGAFIVRDMPKEAVAEVKATTAYKVADQIMKVVTPTPPPTLTNSEKLYRAARSFLGTDASPKDAAPDELGCVDSVNEVYRKAFGAALTTPDTLSTTQLFTKLSNDTRFFKLLSSGGAKAGDIIISPTGRGSNITAHGHVGIVGKNPSPDGSLWVMSNSSAKGVWEANYTLTSWYKSFAVKQSFPVEVFRCVG